VCARHWGGVQEPSRKKLVSIVCAALKSLLRALKAAPPSDDADADADDDDGTPEDSVHTRRNAFKMLLFLLTEVATTSARLEAEEAASGDKPAAKEGAGGKAGKKAGAKGGGSGAGAGGLAALADTCMHALHTAVGSDFCRLWPLGVPEEVRVGPGGGGGGAGAPCRACPNSRAHAASFSGLTLCSFVRWFRRGSPRPRSRPTLPRPTPPHPTPPPLPALLLLSRWCCRRRCCCCRCCC
jgi:hypothetical protein